MGELGGVSNPEDVDSPGRPACSGNGDRLETGC